MHARRPTFTTLFAAAAVFGLSIGPFNGKVMAQGVAAFPPPGDEGSGEKELRAMAAAYPDHVSAVEERDGDWALQVDREWFWWAHGRILPEAERSSWEQYSRYRFYSYPLGNLPPLPVLDDAAAARLKNAVEESRRRPPNRSEAFLEQLYGAGSRAKTASQITSVDFLGFRVQVHAKIAAPLMAAAREIGALGKTDPRVTVFLRSLAKVDGFNYRDVAGTASRSYHSYGLAVDFIPRSYGGKAAYWRWAMDTNDQWWAIPYERRWMIPSAVIAALEKQGFVWGGKWLFFDMMHFEYRPEILVLSRAEGAEGSAPKSAGGTP